MRRHWPLVVAFFIALPLAACGDPRFDLSGRPGQLETNFEVSYARVRQKLTSTDQERLRSVLFWAASGLDGFFDRAGREIVLSDDVRRRVEADLNWYSSASLDDLIRKRLYQRIHERTGAEVLALARDWTPETLPRMESLVATFKEKFSREFPLSMDLKTQQMLRDEIDRVSNRSSLLSAARVLGGNVGSGLLVFTVTNNRDKAISGLSVVTSRLRGTIRAERFIFPTVAPGARRELRVPFQSAFVPQEMPTFGQFVGSLGEKEIDLLVTEVYDDSEWKTYQEPLPVALDFAAKRSEEFKASESHRFRNRVLNNLDRLIALLQ